MTDSPRTPTAPPFESRSTVLSAPAVQLQNEGSPHGKVKASRRRWPWLVFFLVFALSLYFLWPKMAGTSASGTKSAAAKGPAPIPVVAAASHTGDIGVFYSGLGAVTPLATVTIRTRVDGQLMSVRYREGDTVHKGDLLVEIDDGLYQAVLTQAEGQRLKDQALLENARIDLARYQVLLAQQAVPEQQFVTQQALVHQDEGAVKLDDGQIKSAQVNLAYCKISAPVTGRVGLRLVDPGNIVHAADTNGLLVITQMDPISAIFTISEDQLPAVLKKITTGQTLEVDAYSRDS